MGEIRGESGTARHWWDRELRAKFSLRFALAVVALTIISGVVENDGWGFVGRVLVVQCAVFTAEGLAALWPSVFGRRAHLLRRLREAWRSFYIDGGTVPDRGLGGGDG